MKSQITRFTRGWKCGGLGPSADVGVGAARARSSLSSEVSASAPKPPPACARKERRDGNGGPVIGHFSFVIGHWSLVIGHWSFAFWLFGAKQVNLHGAGGGED